MQLHSLKYHALLYKKRKRKKAFKNILIIDWVLIFDINAGIGF